MSSLAVNLAVCDLAQDLLFLMPRIFNGINIFQGLKVTP